MEDAEKELDVYREQAWNLAIPSKRHGSVWMDVVFTRSLLHSRGSFHSSVEYSRVNGRYKSYKQALSLLDEELSKYNGLETKKKI